MPLDACKIKQHNNLMSTSKSPLVNHTLVQNLIKNLSQNPTLICFFVFNVWIKYICTSMSPTPRHNCDLHIGSNLSKKLSMDLCINVKSLPFNQNR